MSEHAISSYVSLEPARPRPDVIASTHGQSLQSSACLLATARTPRHHPSQPQLRPLPCRGAPDPFPAGFAVPGPPVYSSAGGVPTHSQDWRTEATPTPPGGLLLARLPPGAGTGPGTSRCHPGPKSSGQWRARHCPRGQAEVSAPRPEGRDGRGGRQEPWRALSPQRPELVVGPARGPCWPRRSSVNSCLPDLEDPSFRTTRTRPTWPRRSAQGQPLGHSVPVVL
uniref:uncharacterized protein LOC720294 isoform X1 n=1 Tax=Macaca mulatta TaxID=9544 RepID=UPI0010A22177|nr:uncharacterized protein LOC720294 isoform X1 [Macaca mulatta]